ncbi:MAG: prophage [Proteobacteria bacterium]|nr:prophage [Pseudomonadota bacterium]
MGNDFNYPLFAFPEVARAAITEIQSETKAPFPMIGSSVLAAMALAVQAQYRIKRREGLESPCSLSVVSICASGERKTTVDKKTLKAFREAEARHGQIYEAQLAEYRATKQVWGSKRRILLRKFEKAIELEESTEQLQIAIQNHELAEPAKPRRLRLLYNDATSAALLHGLHENTRSAALTEDEGARFFGGQIAEDASLVNKGWDGSRLTVDRRSTESFSVESPRITLNLMVQPSAFEKYMEKKGEEARGVGFFARWLVCCPASTQGTRFQDESIPVLTEQTKFNDRVRELLEMQVANGAMGSARSETFLTFSAEAEREWIFVANQIEDAIRPGGLFCVASDYASKVAENIARIAGVIHAFSGSDGTQIQIETLRSATAIAEWYAKEFVRLFAPADPLRALVHDAILLENWIVKIVQARNWRYIEKNFILQYGPSQLRSKNRLDWAINHLAQHQRLIVAFAGKRKQILDLNPSYFIPVAQGQIPFGFPALC